MTQISRMMPTTMLVMSACAFVLLGTTLVSQELAAQEVVTATPDRIDSRTVAPEAEQFNITETATWTPTPAQAIQIEAIEGANVRSQPSTESEVLGQIAPGETYNVIRRYYKWIEFQYDVAPTRRGWVFDELVTVIGNVEAIPAVEDLDDPEVTDTFDATATRLSITQTPGGLLTATAEARAGGDVAGEAVATIDLANRAVDVTGNIDLAGALPTYTYPPGVVAIAPTRSNPQEFVLEEEQVPSDAGTLPLGVPPIVPIAALGGLGLVGLLVSSIRFR